MRPEARPIEFINGQARSYGKKKVDNRNNMYITNLKLTRTSLQNYLSSLGKARTAQVQRDARIGEAQFKRDAVIRVNI